MKICFLLLCAALTFSCSTNGSNVANQIQNAENLKGTHGFLYFSLPNVTSIAQTTLIVKDAKTGREYTLQRDANTGAGIGGWLPAGQYFIKDMFAKNAGQYPPIGVDAGVFTNGGGVLWFGVGGYERVLLPIHHRETTDDALTIMRRQASNFVNAEPVNWRPEKVPPVQKFEMPGSGLGLIVDLIGRYDWEKRKTSSRIALKSIESIDAFYAAASKSVPPITAEGVELDDGRIIFGAALGQIRVRTTDGEWDAHDTGTLAKILAVAKLRNQVVAVSEKSEILLSDQSLTEWKKIGVLPADKVFWDIDTDEDTFFIVLRSEVNALSAKSKGRKFTFSVFQTSEPSLIDLKLLKSVVVSSENFPAPRAKIFGTKYILFAGADIHIMDISAKQWTQTSPGHSIAVFHMDAPSSLMTAFVPAGLWSKLSISEDGGKTWNTRDEPSYPVQDIAFYSAQNAKAIRTEVGAFSVAMEMVELSSDGKKWNVITKTPDSLCAYPISDKAKQKFFCVTGNGDIMRFER